MRRRPATELKNEKKKKNERRMFDDDDDDDAGGREAPFAGEVKRLMALCQPTTETVALACRQGDLGLKHRHL